MRPIRDYFSALPVDNAGTTTIVARKADGTPVLFARSQLVTDDELEAAVDAGVADYLTDLPAGGTDARLLGIELDGDPVLIPTDTYVTQAEFDAALALGGTMTVASESEVDAGTNDTKAVTPLRRRQKASTLEVPRSAATGDGTAAIAAVLAEADALAAATQPGVRAVVEFPTGRSFNVTGLTIPTGVRVIGNGSRLVMTGTGPVVTMGASYSGLEDMMLVGRALAASTSGVLLPASSGWNTLEGVICDQMSGPAIQAGTNSTVHRIIDCFGQNCLLDVGALATPTGVLHLDGFDHIVRGGEFTASRATLSGNGNAYAVAVLAGMSSFEGVIAELSDHGWYIANGNNKLANCRADLNAGHGFVLVSPSHGSIVGCEAVSNGRQAANTYDGWNVANGTKWRFSACGASGTGNTHRYGFRDFSDGNTNFSQYDAACFSSNHGTAAIRVEDFAGSRVAAMDGPFIGVAAGATTIDVQAFSWPHSRYFLQSVAPVNMTDFTNHVTGMEVLILGDGQTTFVNNGSVLQTTTNANKLAVGGVIYRFVNASGIWREVT